MGKGSWLQIGGLLVLCLASLAVAFLRGCEACHRQEGGKGGDGLILFRAQGWSPPATQLPPYGEGARAPEGVDPQEVHAAVEWRRPATQSPAFKTLVVLRFHCYYSSGQPAHPLILCPLGTLCI